VYFAPFAVKNLFRRMNYEKNVAHNAQDLSGKGLTVLISRKPEKTTRP